MMDRCVRSQTEMGNLKISAGFSRKRQWIRKPAYWAFHFALFEYCNPYKLSHGSNKKFKLDTSLIPKERLPFHEWIISSRDNIHAHSDLTVMDAELHVHEFMGQRYTLIPQSLIHGTEELSNLQEIIGLIEATLDNMYTQEKVLKNALTP